MGGRFVQEHRIEEMGTDAMHKKASTLRVSPKKEKPSSRIVFRYGKQDNEVKSYFAWRKQIKKASS
jgi:hypothetical protein